MRIEIIELNALSPEERTRRVQTHDLRKRRTATFPFGHSKNQAPSSGQTQMRREGMHFEALDALGMKGALSSRVTF